MNYYNDIDLYCAAWLENLIKEKLTPDQSPSLSLQTSTDSLSVIFVLTPGRIGIKLDQDYLEGNQ